MFTFRTHPPGLRKCIPTGPGTGALYAFMDSASKPDKIVTRNHESTHLTGAHLELEVSIPMVKKFLTKISSDGCSILNFVSKFGFFLI